MTKAELIERTIDAIIDPWNDCAEDYLHYSLINSIEEAAGYLAELRRDQDAMDLDEDEKIHDEVTPALYMEAYNCLVRARKHEARVKRLAEFITDNEMVCEYSNYYLPEHKDAIDIVPVDFLFEGFKFDIGDLTPNPFFLIELGQRSSEFNFNHLYCWYDKKKNKLFSTDTPFADGILNAKAFAEYILSDEGKECFDYITNDIMDAEDFRRVFGYEKEE